jgi:deoxyribose-phosphate aldolase
MNDHELDEIAQEVVRRLLAERRAVAPTAKLSVVAGRSEAGAAGRAASAPVAVPPAAAARPLEDISWRGPRMLAAWTPAAGARRVADFVDHTLLKPEATRKDILKLCAEAREHRFAAVCVNPCWVELCAEEVAGTEVAVASVCGFPLGATTWRAKASEAGEVVSRGATEVDMVAALGPIKGGEWGYVEDDIRAVVEATGGRAGRGVLVKVIIESAILSPEEIVKASTVVKLAGGHFVKTSTGFHAAGGATTAAVRLMRLAVGDDLGVKASGGVRDCATALAMIGAGASRIGTSSGVSFVGCLGPEPLSLAELLKQPEAHAASCRSGSCAAPAGGQVY